MVQRKTFCHVSERLMARWLMHHIVHKVAVLNSLDIHSSNSSFACKYFVASISKILAIIKVKIYYYYYSPLNRTHNKYHEILDVHLSRERRQTKQWPHNAQLYSLFWSLTTRIISTIRLSDVTSLFGILL